MFKRFITVERKFDAAHHLENYDGQCANMHGHTWKVVAKFEFSKLDKAGIACDFKMLKEVVDEVLPDHKIINDWIKAKDLNCLNPTAEELSKIIFFLIRESINIDGPLSISSVEIWESDHAYATYEEVF